MGNVRTFLSKIFAKNIRQSTLSYKFTNEPIGLGAEWLYCKYDNNENDKLIEHHFLTFDRYKNDYSKKIK